MAENYTDSGYTPVQAGAVHGNKKPRPPKPTTDDTPVEVSNERHGNATVGAQVDEITGPFTIRRSR